MCVQAAIKECHTRIAHSQIHRAQTNSKKERERVQGGLCLFTKLHAPNFEITSCNNSQLTSKYFQEIGKKEEFTITYK
jgi:hypothetical protein